MVQPRNRSAPPGVLVHKQLLHAVGGLPHWLVKEARQDAVKWPTKFRWPSRTDSEPVGCANCAELQLVAPTALARS